MNSITESLWKKAVVFHGHVCPGLMIGFRAAFLPGSVLGDMEQLLGQQGVTSSIGDSSSIRAELAHFYIIIYTAG